MSKFRFIAGMPRSGSTLLANILCQNPNFIASGTSGIMDVMFGVRNQWDNLIEFKATPNEEGKKRVLRGILEAYYPEDKIIFDKCRGWLSLIEMAEYVLDEKVKILVPVRDMRDVLASFERLWRATNANMMAHPEGAYFNFQTIKGRLDYWALASQPIGLAFNRIKDAIARGYRDRMHIIGYEDLTRKPQKTMEAVYEFLGEPLFQHDFDNVEQINKEEDAFFGFKDLHKIRPKVEPNSSTWLDTLGPEAENFKVNYY